MSRSIKISLMLLATVVLILILIFIDTNGDINNVNQLYSPMIWASSFTISIFYPNVRKYLFRLSYCLMILMLIFYFTQRLDLSNWFGSLGFGLLIFLVVSCFPELIKKGYVDKF